MGTPPDDVCQDVSVKEGDHKLNAVGSDERLCCLCNAGQYMSKICK